MKKIIVVLSVLCICCEHSSVHTDMTKTTHGSLEGKWIDTNMRTDTLVFDSRISDKMLLVFRGKEVRNGSLQPKQGSGLYEFKLEPEAISVYNMISSCYCFNSYIFSLDGSVLRIGNFFDPASPGEVRTFRKL